MSPHPGRPALRRRRLLPLAGAAAALALAAAGCGDDGAGNGGAPAVDPASAVVEYHFQDSSVPPEHHRSYTLTVEPSGARIVVDSYGDVLHDERAPVDDATWSQLIAAVEGVDGLGGGGADDCAGGTAHDLWVTDGEHGNDDPAIAAHVPVCGGDGREDADRVERAVRPALDLFDMETLLAAA
ncbi:MAG TPA: hypothetical protein VIL48_03215 [Acidimicrobiales bacterium]